MGGGGSTFFYDGGRCRYILVGWGCLDTFHGWVGIAGDLFCEDGDGWTSFVGRFG